MRTIDATSITLQDLFLKDGEDGFEKYTSRKLLIPSFQRNYAWDKKHVHELIESINNSSTIGYYVGNILIQNKSRHQDLIIDGQQRVTTLFLIIKSLLIKLGAKDKNIANEVLFYDEQKLKSRIVFTRKNLSDAFLHIMLNTDPSLDDESPRDENARKIITNFKYIQKEINKIEDIKRFFKKVLNIVFVVIRFEDGFDVNQLFEGLNSKGKILSPVQLTKNVIIGNTDDSNEEKITDLWENMENDFEKGPVSWFEKFLRHHCFYRYGYVSNKDLFRKIKSDVSKTSVLNFSKMLKDDSELYLKIRRGDISKKDISDTLSNSDWIKLEQILKHISGLGLEQVFSVIFSSIKYAQDNEKYRKGNKSKFYRDIYSLWSFAILTKYLDTKPSLYERAFAKYTHELQSTGSQASKDLNKAMFEIIRTSNKNKFVENIKKRIRITGKNEKNLNSTNDRNHVSPLLLLYLTNGANLLVTDLTIEHIIPKGSLEHWRIDSRYIKEVEKERFGISNLTLLENDDLGNKSFRAKSKAYKKSIFSDNKKIGEKYRGLGSVNPLESLHKRGNEVGQRLYKILKKQIKL